MADKPNFMDVEKEIKNAKNGTKTKKTGKDKNNNFVMLISDKTTPNNTVNVVIQANAVNKITKKRHASSFGKKFVEAIKEAKENYSCQSKYYFEPAQFFL